MGYIRHRFAYGVLSDFDEKKLEPALSELKKRMGKEPFFDADIILGPFKGTNGYLNYCFAADGSKVGWTTSEIAEKYRHEFMDIIKNAGGSVIEAQLGGDDGETLILSTTDSICEVKP